MFSNIHGKRSFFNDPDSFKFVHDADVSFLCETWNRSPSSMLPDRVFFSAPASYLVHDAPSSGSSATHRPARGRPSGGLEIYCRSFLSPSLISSSASHIAVSLPSRSLLIIGIYFRPNSELDDVTETLLSAIGSCPEGFQIIVGGDFNLNPSDPEFNELCYILHSHNIILSSNGVTPTFIGPAGY